MAPPADMIDPELLQQITQHPEFRALKPDQQAQIMSQIHQKAQQLDLRPEEKGNFLQQQVGEFQKQARTLAGRPAQGYRELSKLGVPGMGLIASLLPETPAGWGVTAAGGGLGPLGKGLLPLAQRAAALSGVGGLTALLTGSKEPVTEGVGEGVGFAAGEKLLGKPLAKLSGWLSRLARANAPRWTAGVADTIAKYVPGAPEGLKGEELHNYVQGGQLKGDLSKFYRGEEDSILQTLQGTSPTASPTLGHPTVMRILQKYFPDEVSQMARNVTPETAFTLTRLLGEDMRGFSAAKKVAQGIVREDYKALNQAIAYEMNTMTGGQVSGVGNQFLRMKNIYDKGNVIKKILYQGESTDPSRFIRKPGGDPELDWSTLGNLSNEYMSDLAERGMGDAISAFTRGAGPGRAGSIIKQPLSLRAYPGGGGLGHIGAHAYPSGHIPNPALERAFPGMPQVGELTGGLVADRLLELLGGGSTGQE